MEKQQLREQLDELGAAIQELNVSDQDRQRLSALMADIEQQLSEPLLDQEPHSLVEQVDSLVSGFERDHPTVAGILNNIMITLSSMGV